jgi:hypothetical protein
MKTLGAVPGVGVGDDAEQLDVFSALAYLLHEVLAERDAARIVVGKNLGDGRIARLDLAVHAEDGKAGGLGAADIRDGTLRIGAVEKHCTVARRDDVVEMRRLLGGVVL